MLYGLASDGKNDFLMPWRPSGFTGSSRGRYWKQYRPLLLRRRYRHYPPASPELTHSLGQAPARPAVPHRRPATSCFRLRPYIRQRAPPSYTRSIKHQIDILGRRPDVDRKWCHGPVYHLKIVGGYHGAVPVYGHDVCSSEAIKPVSVTPTGRSTASTSPLIQRCTAAWCSIWPSASSLPNATTLCF